MSEDYYFFFSYASANHANAQWVKPGLEGNHLDEFFEALCRAVSDQVAHQADQVAYRDVKRISMGDFWGQELAEGLQKSRILIALISPHYLKSYNCGRELGFFNKRLQEFRQRAEHNVSQPYRILPLFWENVDTCLKSAHPSVARFLRRYNFTEEGMPATYPAKGLKQICEFRTGTDYEQMYNCIARRIVHL